MNCPRCGYLCHSTEKRCPLCGSPQDKEVLSLPAPKKRYHWIPLCILAAMFLIGTILFFMIPMDAAQTPSATANSYFTVVDGALYFDQSQYNGNPVLTVPEMIGEQPVTSIGEGCFENVTGITTIVLPDSVLNIGNRAFAQCDDLRGLSIPKGVNSIGAGAFFGCDELEAVYIPNAVDSIGEDAFEGCPSMRYLFYSGFYTELYNMYPEMITPFTSAICLDGAYNYAAK